MRDADARSSEGAAAAMEVAGCTSQSDLVSQLQDAVLVVVRQGAAEGDDTNTLGTTIVLCVHFSAPLRINK